MNWFFKRNINSVVEDKIEYCVMEKFAGNRILFTAEHAIEKRIPLKRFGSDAYIKIGDKNTDILAKIACCSLRSAYIFPKFIRTKADASRDPNDLGKGLTLYQMVYGVKKKIFINFPIHNDTNYKKYLDSYNETIEKMNPRLIVSIHGMDKRRKFDLSLGFGKNYQYISGLKNARRFKNSFVEFLKTTFGDLDLDFDLKVNISQLFRGEGNYVLRKHVIENNLLKVNDSNNKGLDKRVGLQVELNARGRVKRGILPTIEYQVATQALGRFFVAWTKGKNLF